MGFMRVKLSGLDYLIQILLNEGFINIVVLVIGGVADELIFSSRDSYISHVTFKIFLLFNKAKI